MIDNVAVTHLTARSWSVRFALGIGLLLALLSLPRVARAGWHPITPILPDFARQPSFKISPDSTTVAFVTDSDEDEVFELYTVSITGTTPVKISPPLVVGGDVNGNRFEFTPDGQSIIYIADQEVDERAELYFVPIGGGTPTKLNAPLVGGGNVQSFLIDDDSDRVVYLADGVTNEVIELFSVPIAGGSAVKLNQALVTGGGVGQYRVDPLSNRVVYTADAETDGKRELYSVPIVGGTVVKLNPPIQLAGGGDGGISDFEINPSLPVVTFTAREAGEPGGNIYTRATAGGDLLGPLNFNLNAEQRIIFFRVSPVGDRIVYNVGTRVGSTNAFKGVLHSALIGGGGAGQVSDSADPLFGSGDFRFLPDGSRVVYNFQKDAASTVRLMSAQIFSTPVNLFAPAASDPQLVNFRFSPDSNWVVYFTSTGGAEVRIFAVPPTGGGATNHGIGNFATFMPDSGRLLIPRSAGSEGPIDLFSVQTFGGGERNLSRLNVQESVLDPTPSPDGRWVVFNVALQGPWQIRVSDGEEGQLPITGLVASNDGPKIIGETVSFSAVITGAESITYEWDLGDGNFSNAITPTHAYDAAGIYTVTVAAAGNANVLTATTTVYIGNAVVEVTNNKFTPQNVLIPYGGTVVWVLREGTHSVTANNGSFDQPAGSDWGVFSHTFEDTATAGVEQEIIPYQCSVHGPSMSGSVSLEGEVVGPEALKVLLPMIDGK